MFLGGGGSISSQFQCSSASSWADDMITKPIINLRPRVSWYPVHLWAPLCASMCSSQSHNSRSQCHCPREHRGPWVGQMGHLPGLHSGTLLGTLRCCSAYNHCKLQALNRGDKNIPTPACHLSVSVQPLQLTGSKLCTEMSLTILSHTQYPSASRTTSHSFPTRQVTFHLPKASFSPQQEPNPHWLDSYGPS